MIIQLSRDQNNLFDLKIVSARMASADVNFIPIASVRSECLVAPRPPQTSPMKPPNTGSTTRGYLSYNRGTPEQPILDEALFELSICDAVVEEDLGMDGKSKNPKAYKMKLTITDQNDIDGMDRLYQGAVNCVDQYKGSYNAPKFDKTRPDGIVKNPLFRSINKATGDIIQGMFPVIYAKVDWKKSIFKEVVPRKDADGKIIYSPEGIPEVETPAIDYKTLLGQDLKVSAIIHWSDIFLASKLAPQVKIRSCVVLKTSGAGNVDHTKSTNLASFLKTQVTDNPAYFDELSDQMGKLRAAGPKPVDGPSLLQTANPGEMPPGFPGASSSAPVQQAVQTSMPPGFPMQQAAPQQQYQPPQQFQQQQFAPQQFAPQIQQQQFTPQTPQQPTQMQFQQIPQTPAPIIQQNPYAMPQQFQQLPIGGGDMSQFFVPQTQLGHQ